MPTLGYPSRARVPPAVTGTRLETGALARSSGLQRNTLEEQDPLRCEKDLHTRRPRQGLRGDTRDRTCIPFSRAAESCGRWFGRLLVEFAPLLHQGWPATCTHTRHHLPLVHLCVDFPIVPSIPHVPVCTKLTVCTCRDLLSNAGAFARSHRWHPSARARLSLGNIALCLPSASGLVTVHALVSVAFEGYPKVWTAFFLPHDCMNVMQAWGLMRPSVPVTSAVAIEARRQLNRWCSMEDVLIRYCGALATLSRPWSRLLTLSDDHWAPVLCGGISR